MQNIHRYLHKRSFKHSYVWIRRKKRSLCKDSREPLKEMMSFKVVVEEELGLMWCFLSDSDCCNMQEGHRNVRKAGDNLCGDSCIWLYSLYLWAIYNNRDGRPSEAVLYCFTVGFCWHSKVAYSPPNSYPSPLFSVCSFSLPSQPSKLKLEAASEANRLAL